ncbi:MAG: TolC family protein [Marinifilaceae bacterium]
MKLYVQIILLSLFLCLSILDAKGQDSLRHYINTALQYNPEILSAALNYQVALEDIKQQGGWASPEVTVGVLTHPMDIMTGKEVTTLDFTQKFEWFGTLSSRKNAYSKQAGAAYQAFNKVRCSVTATVEENWYDLLSTKELIKIVNENIVFIDQLVTLAQGEMQSTTSGAYANILELQIEQSEQRAEVINLQQQASALSISFNALLNRAPTAIIVMPDSLQPDTTFYPLQMDSYLITQQNPELLANEQLQEFHDEMVKSTRRNSLPKFGLGLQYKFVDKTKRAEMMGDKNGRDIIMPMVTVALPIYRKQYNGAIEKQKLQSQIARNNYQTILNRLQSEYSQYIAQRTSSLNTIHQFEQIVQLKKQLLQIYTAEFSAGQRSMSSLIALYREILSYQRQTVLLIKTYNINTAHLNELMGTYSLKSNNYEQ